MTRNSSNASFYIAVVLYSIYLFLSNWGISAEGLGDTLLRLSFMILANYVVLIACCIFILHSIAKKFGYYVRNKWFTLIFIGVFMFLVITVKNVTLVLPLLLGFAGINSVDRVTAKTIAISLSALLFISCILSFLGLTGGDAISKPLFGDSGVYSNTVSALGLLNPNNVMLIFINIIAMSLYLCKTERQSLYTSIVLAILTVVLSSATGSTTGFAVGLATIILIHATKHHKNILRILRKVTPWMLAIITVASFIVGSTFGALENIPNPVNDILTNRPYTWDLRIKDDSYLNVYGNKDQYQVDESAAEDALYPFDNMPLSTLVHYGVIVYLVFFYIFYFGTKRIRNPVILVYIFIACILMFVERMYLYSIVLIFLQKAITEHYLLKRGNNNRSLHDKI